MSSLLNLLAEYADKIPFAAVATGGGAPKVSVIRIVEAAVIAGVIGAAGYFLMVPRVIEGVTVRMEYLQKDVEKNTENIERNRERIANLRSRVDQSHPTTGLDRTNLH